MRIARIVFLGIVILSWNSSNAAVVEYSLIEVLTTKTLTESAQITVPILVEAPCLVASIRINLEGEGETEVIASFDKAGEIEICDQVTFLQSGPYVLDISSGVRYAQAAGLTSATFDIGEWIADKNFRIKISEVEKSLGRVTLTYGHIETEAKGGGSGNSPESLEVPISSVSPAIQVSVSPNPFNPTTSIFLEMKTPAIVELKIFDIAGKLIRRLSSGFLNAGRSEFSWNGVDEGGRRVPSGLYFYQCKTPAELVSGKMILLK